MQKLVFFGKGGIGKSTLSANMSAVLASMGKRVLHVGCDPKRDSTASLLNGELVTPVVDKFDSLDGVRPEDIVTRSSTGVDCVEAGGPEAGVGCGGRGISRMFEIFQAAELLDESRYDVCVYDVLGDVVCGGFAAPLRKGVGEKVAIVTSEEVMSLYAANNIARAVVHYRSNGVGLAGIVANVRDNDADRAPLEHFAAHIGTRVIGWVERDPIVRDAEYERTTVVEHAPRSAFVERLRVLAKVLLEIDPATLPVPTPLDEASFHALTKTKFAGPRPKADARPTAGAGVSAARLASAPKEARASRFTQDLRAGAQAVRLGRVSPDEALRRLRATYPHEARGLTPLDLTHG